jgi:phasin family protein
MATPPKIPPSRVSAGKSAFPKAAGVSKKGPVAPPVKKAAPFVIESDSLAAFVDHSDAALPPTAKPKAVSPVKVKAMAPAVVKPVEKPVKAVVVTPAPKAPVAVSAPIAASVPAPAVVAEAPVTAPIAKEIEAPTPPQPVVVEPLTAAIKTSADRLVPNALEGHHIMNEAIETGKKFAEDAKTRLQGLAVNFNDKTKAALEKSSKAVEELSDLAKGNVEALVESSKIAAKGLETLGQDAAEYGRSSFEKTSATLKSFASVKSPVEFFQLQSELMTSMFDTVASQSAKNSEAFLKLAGDIAQPLSNRAAIVSDKIKALAA